MDREDYSEIDGNIKNWFAVKRKGKEREIELTVVVELFRFIFYAWFCLTVLIGVALTYGFTVKENKDFVKIIEGVFGSVNVCAFFDFPPATYVLPTMYSIQMILIYKYSFCSIFRAWIARLENKISGFAFFFYSSAFAYFFVSALVFSTIFAVQPDPNNPNTILIHTVPFTNLVIALTILQIAVTWFGRNVCWKGMRHTSKLTKRMARFFTYTCLTALIITSIFKVIHQINALSDVWNLTVQANETNKPAETKLEYRGIWFNVHAHKNLLQIVDKLWLISALVCPMVQSGYLTFKTFHSHLIIFTVRDNRRANPAERVTQNGENEHELSLV